MSSTKYPLIAPPGGGAPNLPGPGQPGPLRPDEFQSGSIANQVTFGFTNIDPPSFVYVQRDDQLFLDVFTNIPAGDTVTFFTRFLRVAEPQGGQPSDGGVGKHPGQVFTRGIIQPDFEVLLPAGSAQATRQINMAEGYLLSVGARSSGSNLRGRTYARAKLIRPNPTIFSAAVPLFADYTTAGGVAGFPNGRFLHPSEGPGWVHSLQVANPAAGADWVLNVGTNQRLRLMTMNADIAVANSGAARPIEIEITDGVNVVARMATNVAAPINATAHVNFSNAGTPSTSIVSDLYAQQPAGVFIDPGHAVRSITTNIVAGDQWSNIWFLVEEWVEAF